MPAGISPSITSVEVDVAFGRLPNRYTRTSPATP